MSELSDLYKKTLLSGYNEVYGKTRFISEYAECIDYILNKNIRFVESNNEELRVFYKYMLIQKYNNSELDKIFDNRFNSYLSNIINFGNGLSVPFLKYKISVSKKTENTHPELYIKTLEPLPDYISVDSPFYISSNSYSSDIINTVILRTDSTDNKNQKIKTERFF